MEAYHGFNEDHVEYFIIAGSNYGDSRDKRIVISRGQNPKGPHLMRTDRWSEEGWTSVGEDQEINIPWLVFVGLFEK